MTSLSLPANSNSLMTSPITTVATTSSSVVTTSSIEGVVTFSGGAVAFPARATEVSAARASNPPTVAENHVTITPVSAAVMASSSAASSSPVPVLTVGSTPTPVVVAASTKKRNNSSEGSFSFQLTCHPSDSQHRVRTPEMSSVYKSQSENIAILNWFTL